MLKIADIACLDYKKHRACLVFTHTHTHDGREKCDAQGLALPRGLWILRDKSAAERERNVKKREREVPAQTPGDSPTIPSICDWQARRLGRFNSLINFINHLLLKNSGTQISPWAHSGPPAEHTPPARPHALWHTGHTLTAVLHSLLQHFKMCFIYLNQLGLPRYITSFILLGGIMITRLLMNINCMSCSDLPKSRQT